MDKNTSSLERNYHFPMKWKLSLLKNSSRTSSKSFLWPQTVAGKRKSRICANVAQNTDSVEAVPTITSIINNGIDVVLKMIAIFDFDDKSKIN